MGTALGGEAGRGGGLGLGCVVAVGVVAAVGLEVAAVGLEVAAVGLGVVVEVAGDTLGDAVAAVVALGVAVGVEVGAGVAVGLEVGEAGVAAANAQQKSMLMVYMLNSLASILPHNMTADHACILRQSQIVCPVCCPCYC